MAEAVGLLKSWGLMATRSEKEVRMNILGALVVVMAVCYLVVYHSPTK